MSTSSRKHSSMHRASSAPPPASDGDGNRTSDLGQPPASKRYLDSMSSSAMQFTPAELFLAPAHDNEDGLLDVQDDLPLAFEICLCTHVGS